MPFSIDALKLYKRLLMQSLNEVSSFSQEDLSTEELIELGQLLWTLSAQVKKQFEPIKAQLREIGAKERSQPGKVVLAGLEQGQTLITIPPPRMVLKKDADIEHLKKALGEDFGKFFSTNYSPNIVAIKEEIVQAPPERKELLLKVLEQKTGTIRVSFQGKGK